MTGEARSGPRLVATSGGRLEVLIRDESGQPRAPVLYFHGGHESAITASASDLYVELGYRVVKVSRPGYGHTESARCRPQPSHPWSTRHVPCWASTRSPR
jgi:pimeloyl-ACP methyl ester carboxylesterase